MRCLRALVAFVPVVLVACDSPGGGGGGGVNCALNPGLPVCQDTSTGPDAGDTSGAETSTNGPGDTTTGDTTPIDTDTDVATDTNVATDTDTVDTTLPPSCIEEDRQCAGNGIEICLDGRWVSGGSCDGATCVDGECQEPTFECSGSERRCSGNIVEVCSGGEWVSSATCPSGCTNGTCNTAPGGDLDCLGVMDCADTNGCFVDGSTDTACITECYQEGSTVGRNEAAAVVSCYDGCGWDAECAYSSCENQRAACFFTGTGNKTCLQIDECLGGCSDQACSDACFASGSATAQAQRLWVVDCASLYCEDLSDQTCLADVFGAGGPCEAAYNACFN